MKGFKYVAWFVIVLMSCWAIRIALTDSFDHGAGFDTFLAGNADPWQTFINNDMMSGLYFALAWIIWRQLPERTIDTVAWVWMIMWWGNIVVAVYVLVALRQSGGDPLLFFRGRKAGALAPVWPTPSLPARALLLVGAAGFAFWTVQSLGHAVGTIGQIGILASVPPIVLSLLLLAFPAGSSRSAPVPAAA